MYLRSPNEPELVSPSDCLVSYPGHSLRESYSSAETQLVYSTAPSQLDSI